MSETTEMRRQLYRVYKSDSHEVSGVSCFSMIHDAKSDIKRSRPKAFEIWRQQKMFTISCRTKKSIIEEVYYDAEN